jgi:hypothetical protein
LHFYASYLFDHMNHTDGVVHVTGYDGDRSQWLITQAAAVRVFAYLAANAQVTAG